MLDIYSIDRKGLLVGRLTGTLDAKTAEEVVEFVEAKEALVDKGFHRFCDLTHLEGIELTYKDIFQLADRRREFNPNDIPVKSAFLATDPLAFGVARMYEQILQSPRIEVRVLRDIQAAAAWLGVGVEDLKL